jgi:hypothetical protein
MIEYPDLKFPPINLWSYPKMPKIIVADVVIKVANDITLEDEEFHFINSKVEEGLGIITNVQRNRWDNFIVFCRTGRFPERAG